MAMSFIGQGFLFFRSIHHNKEKQMDDGTQDDIGLPAFSRGGDVEIRYWCPPGLVAVLDAVVMARGGLSANIHRGTVMLEMMGEWAEKKRHEAMLIHRVAVCNPTDSESGRRVQELRVVEAKA